MLEFFRKKARKIAVKEAVKNSLKRKVQLHNFGNSKTAGIVICYNYEVENDSLNMIRNILKDNNIESKMLIYYPQDKLPDNVISNPGKILISKKECNWYGKPAGKEITDFINEKFDMLIDFSDDKYFALQYIATASAASFKAGRANYENNPYDFVLLDKNDDSDEKFVKNLENYLAKLKR